MARAAAGAKATTRSLETAQPPSPPEARMLAETPGGQGGRPPLDDEAGHVLDSEPRRRLLRLVRKSPGIRVSDLQLDADMSAGSFYHHLRHLRRVGLLETRAEGAATRAYPAGSEAPAEPGPLGSGTARDVARAVLKRPGCTSAEISARVGIAPRTARLHLQALRKAGLVERGTRGWTRHYAPTERLRAALSDEK